MNKYLFFFLLIINLSSLSGYEKDKIAILNFKAINIDSGIAEGITETFITYIVNSDSYQVVERTQLNKVIDELELSQNEDFNDQTAIKIGKLAKAKLITIGSIVKIGKKYSINVRLIEVETSNIKLAKRFDARNEGSISKALKKISKAISKFEKKEYKYYSSFKDDEDLVKRTITILPFYDQDETNEFENITSVIRDNLKSKLQLNNIYDFINYSDIDKTIQKLKFKNNQIVDEKNASIIALNLNSDIVIAVKYVVIDQDILISSNTIDALGLKQTIVDSYNGKLDDDFFKSVDKYIIRVTQNITEAFPKINEDKLDNLIAERKEKLLTKEVSVTDEEQSEEKNEERIWFSKEEKMKYIDYRRFYYFRGAALNCSIIGAGITFLLGMPFLLNSIYFSSFLYSSTDQSVSINPVLLSIGASFTGIGISMIITSIVFYVHMAINYGKWKAVKNKISYSIEPYLSTDLQTIDIGFRLRI